MSDLDCFRGRSVLVVGGAGFIGSNLCRRLLVGEPAKVTVVDNLLSAEIENVPNDSRIEMCLGSIADDRLLASLPDGFDFVFHLATYHGNQSSMHDPIADHANNTVTTLKLLDRLRAGRTPEKIIYASAGCTVARKTFENAVATTEEDPVSLFLDSPYQISKIVGEMYGNYYFMRHGLPFVKARFQNVYGPGEILGAGSWRGTPATVWRNVVPTFVWKALHHEPLPVENGGIATRDFIFVEDIVEGLIACAAKGVAGETYNLASGVETSIRELADRINAMVGSDAEIAMQPARSWDRSGKRFGNPSKAKDALEFVARVDLDEGIARTIAWTRGQASLIQRCIDRHRIFMRSAG